MLSPPPPPICEYPFGGLTADHAGFLLLTFDLQPDYAAVWSLLHRPYSRNVSELPCLTIDCTLLSSFENSPLTDCGGTCSCNYTIYGSDSPCNGNGYMPMKLPQDEKIGGVALLCVCISCVVLLTSWSSKVEPPNL